MAFDPEIHPEYRRHDPLLVKDDKMDIIPHDVLESAMLDIKEHGDSIKEIIILFRLDPYSTTDKARQDINLYKHNTTNFVDTLGLMSFCRMSMEHDFQRICKTSEED